MIDVIVDHPRFTIYGEIHNQIDNNAYKKIYSTFKKDEIVMCEHTTFKPFLEMEQKVFDENGFSSLLQKMKGSEWIYVKCLSDKRSVVCVDVRVENNFPMAYQEMEFAELGLSNPIFCLSFIKKVLSNAIQHKEIYAKHPQTKEMYQELTEKIMESYTKIREFFKGNVEDEEAINEFETLSAILKRLASLFVDIHILNLVLEQLEKEGPHMSIFVGARHAITLSRLLSCDITQISDVCKQFL